jgi:hypothetical protein
MSTLSSRESLGGAFAVPGSAADRVPTHLPAAKASRCPTDLARCLAILCRAVLHIIDQDPTSLSANGWLEDTSKVEKYVMSEEDYNKRDNTYRWAGMAGCCCVFVLELERCRDMPTLRCLLMRGMHAQKKGRAPSCTLLE